MFDLEEFIGYASSDDTIPNLIEIYKGHDDTSGMLGSKVIKVASAKNTDIFPGATATTFVEYHHRDIVYVYDTSNDGQKVYRKVPLHSWDNGSLYAFAYVEETLPGHRFPCTNAIDAKVKISRKVQRVNNRVAIVQDYNESSKTYTVYAVYRHSPTVDVKKIGEDLNKALHRI